jgi:hypothetical protein
MSQYNTRAVILRTNANHSIRCSAAEERRLVMGINELLKMNGLSEESLGEMLSVLPASFFETNGFDNPKQYARLLWEALDTAELAISPQPAVANVSNVTNFNAPVQAQVLQTGPNSTAKVVQQSQQNQLYSQAMQRELESLSDIIKVEIVDEDERTEALEIVDKAKEEASKVDAKPSKVKKILSGLGNWTGERLTKAVDAAISVGVKYGMTGHS